MTDTPEVHQVWIHVKLPTSTRPAQLAYGFYTLKDDVVTMTDRKGVPATDQQGRTYTSKLDGETPQLIAGRLTKKLRDALHGKDAAPSGFNRQIVYSNKGIV
jgi:hypothetical protein